MTRNEAPAKRGFMARFSATRTRVRSTRVGLIIWRGLATILGVLVIVVGIALLALPGPGWLIIFAGLGILATEFAWAARLLQFARAKVASWVDWVATQGPGTKVLIGFAGLVVLAALVGAAWWFYAG